MSLDEPQDPTRVWVWKEQAEKAGSPRAALEKLLGRPVDGPVYWKLDKSFQRYIGKLCKDELRRDELATFDDRAYVSPGWLI